MLNFKYFNLTVWTIVAVMSIGWIMNVYKLIQCDFTEPWKEEVLRIIGVFSGPVGSLMGLLW